MDSLLKVQFFSDAGFARHVRLWNFKVVLRQDSLKGRQEHLYVRLQVWLVNVASGGPAVANELLHFFNKVSPIW